LKFDFIEIGTSNFDTLIEKADDNTFGISIEPLKVYLDDLPNPKNVVKLNCAISLDSSTNDIDFFYISPDIIKEHRLKPFLRGCNCIGNYHPMHVKHKLEKHVAVTKVKQKTYESIISDYNITELEYLKIDTEGGDCRIMEQVFNCSNKLKPKKIKFETNSLSKQNEVNNIIKKFKTINYSVLDTNKQKTDTVLILN